LFISTNDAGKREGWGLVEKEGEELTEKKKGGGKEKRVEKLEDQTTF
jgi:hypothetical protein